MKKSTHLSFAQKTAALRELEKYCTKSADGFAVYAPGWDDNRVAAVCGHPVNNIHIRGIRRECIGNVKRGDDTQRTIDMQLAMRLTDIEDYLTRQNPNWRAALSAAA